MDDDIVAKLKEVRLPVYVVAKPPISTGHATTAELLREYEVISWRIAQAEQEYGWTSQEAEVVYLLVRDELRSIEREIERRESARHAKSAPRWPDAPPDKRAEWDEIKRRTDIVDLAEKLIGGGRAVHDIVWYRCFAHEDNTPSLAVYGEPDPHFHCFSCGLHGDCIDLARHAMHLTSFSATMAILGEWAGVTSRTIAIETPDGVKEVTPE